MDGLVNLINGLAKDGMLMGVSSITPVNLPMGGKPAKREKLSTDPLNEE